MLPKHPDQLTDKQLDEWLRSLLDNAEPEGVLLDYKEQLNVGSQGERREVAKDISSFANELGGTLVYGIPEQRTQPQAAPTPIRPYGIETMPGVEQVLENIFLTTISPLLPEYRIRRVVLSEYPGMVCYVVWTSESWVGPHMVHGYKDGRFYRRGQFRAVRMSERDVEDRYRRRLSMRNAAEEFLTSEQAAHLSHFLGRRQAKTSLMLVPLLLIPNRLAFDQSDVRAWLAANIIDQQWSPSMHGVVTDYSEGTGRDTKVGTRK